MSRSFGFAGLAAMGVVAVACFGSPGASDPSTDTPASDGAEAAVTETRPLPAEFEELSKRVTATPDDLELRRRLATGLHDAGYRAESLEHFEAIAASRTDRRSLLDLALAYGSVSKLEQAETTYRRLLALVPGDPIALHNLGNLAMKTDRVDDAIRLYLEALQQDPRYMLARLHVGEAFERAGRFREAYRAFESVLEFEPRDARELEALDGALYGMAALDLQMGALERARTLLVEVLRARPDHPNAHYSYGQVLVRLGRPDEAAKAFETHRKLLAERKTGGTMASED